MRQKNIYGKKAIQNPAMQQKESIARFANYLIKKCKYKKALLLDQRKKIIG